MTRKNKKGNKSSHRGQNMGDNQKLSKVHNEPSTQTSAKERERDTNPLLTAQKNFLKSLSPHPRTHFFSPTHVTPEQRAEIWEDQANLGETLVNSYAWTTPDPRLLKVFQHFGPIVEVGCGANAYWSKWINTEGGVNVVAFDMSLDSGGKISGTERPKKKSKKSKAINGNIKAGGFVIRQGSPETLSKDAEIRDSGRTLFLCYPDEEDYQPDCDDAMGVPTISMAAACLEHFSGSTIIHVGELYGDTLSLEQAPFGRSSSDEFQQRLAGEYHCILKMKLENNWLHVRDTLSVWKRSETCCMTFENDDDDDDEQGDEDDGDVYYKYIPPEETLPIDLAAPCVAHLLKKGKDSTKETDVVDYLRENDSSNTGQVDVDRKSGELNDGGENIDECVIAGSAW